MANRESIRVHGLDWTRMGAAPGIAGSTAPEAAGVFLCGDEFEAGFFIEMNNTGGPVDVWAVTGIDEDQMVDNGNGFLYFPGRISAGQVTLAERAPAGAAPAGGQADEERRRRKRTPRAGHGRRARRSQ